MFKLTRCMLLIVLLLVRGGSAIGPFLQTEQQEEGRGVWISARMFSSVKEEAVSQIRDILNKHATIGINNLFCFSSMIEQHQKGWDFIRVLIKEAHTREMKVHPIFCPGYRIKLEGEIKEHPEWLIRGVKGEIYPYLNLANPDAREHTLRKISEALKYNIDGIHLDYIRFQVNQGFSYDKTTCNAFKKVYGQSPLELRHHDCGSLIWCEWIKWNSSCVTTFLKEVRNLIKKSGKKIPLSTAVFPGHESAKMLIAQYWEKWAKEEIIDILCPMLYTNNTDIFRRYIKEAVRVANGKCFVYAGIACSSSHNKNTPEGVEEEVRIAREEGVDGVVFFSGYSLTEEFINKLKSGVFKGK